MKPKICVDCKDAIRSYLGISGNQDDFLRLIRSLCQGVVSDEGLDSESLARLGCFIDEHLTRREALHHFFFGEPKLSEIRDRGTANAELALIKTRLDLEDEEEEINSDEDDDETDN